MGAQRKLADPALTAPLEDVAPIEDVSQPERAVRQPVAGDLPISPAILLQEQLAARLAVSEAGAAQVPGAGAADTVEAKWPMPLRVATIVGLSLALWGGIFLATVAVLT